ncbi:hypothetical protein TNCV_1456371 [Trichonephila clavipes]|nr:hypothetical protein TNCV_1456371 [Trichonephila clavipes]
MILTVEWPVWGHPDCNTVLNPIPAILNALDKKEDDTVWDKGDYGTNSEEGDTVWDKGDYGTHFEVTWDNGSDESFSDIDNGRLPDCNTVLNPIPGRKATPCGTKEDDTVWDKGDYGTNSEVTWDNGSDESFSKHMILTVEWPVCGGHPDCNTVLNPIPGILNALDKRKTTPCGTKVITAPIPKLPGTMGVMNHFRNI